MSIEIILISYIIVIATYSKISEHSDAIPGLSQVLIKGGIQHVIQRKSRRNR